MNRLLVLFYSIIAVLVSGGCIGKSARGLTPETTAGRAAEYRKITAREAKDKMDGGEDFILLDVRTSSEFKEKHIDGAMLIPNEEIKKRAPDELPDKDALILVYCRSGGRSAQASKELVKMGYTNIYDMGGINDWPFDTVSG